MTANVSLLKGFDTRHFWNDIDGNSTTTDPTIWAFPQELVRWARLTGDFDYNGGDVAIGNTYTEVEIYDDAALTDLRATLTSTTPIAFTNFFDSEEDALAGNDTIDGSPEDDVITGHGGADNMDGGGGNDAFRFFNGDVGLGEIVDGGTGNDGLFVIGSNVDFRQAAQLSNLDYITFDAASGTQAAIFNNTQFGVGGQLPNNVTITGRLGLEDIIDIRVTGPWLGQFYQFIDWDNLDKVRVTGSSGFDDITGTSQIDIINAGAGFDLVNAGNGDDTIQIFGNQALSDFINGGNGFDTLQIIGAISAVMSFFNAANSSTERCVGNNKGILGTSGNNDFNFSYLQQKTGVPFIDGQAGNDNITGTKFADDLRGGKGNDTVNGGAGNDVLTGGLNKDKLIGGANKDTYNFDNINESKPGTFDTIVGFSRAQHDRVDVRGIDANTTKGGNQSFKFIGSDPFDDPGQARWKGGFLYLNTDNDFAAEARIKVPFLTDPDLLN